MIQPSFGKEKGPVLHLSVLGCHNIWTARPARTVALCQMAGGHCFLGIGGRSGKLDIEVVAAAAPLRLSSYLPSAQSPLARATLCSRLLVLQWMGRWKSATDTVKTRWWRSTGIKSDGMRLLWLVMTFLPLACSHQPRCKLTTLSSQAPGTTRGEVIVSNLEFHFLSLSFSLIHTSLLHPNFDPYSQIPCALGRVYLPLIPADLHGQPELCEGGAGRSGQVGRQARHRSLQLLSPSTRAQLPHTGQAACWPKDRE